MPNAEYLGRTRPNLHPGDVFAMRMYTQEWLFGRVVVTGQARGFGPMPGATLIYIYAARQPTPEPNRALLLPSQLLIPPAFTNRLGWVRGFWRTVERWPLEPGETLARHCFSTDRWGGAPVDEYGERLPVRLEPCGEFGLFSYAGLDDEISDALGLPRAPLTSDERAYFAKRGLALPTAPHGYREEEGAHPDS